MTMEVYRDTHSAQIWQTKICTLALTHTIQGCIQQDVRLRKSWLNWQYAWSFNKASIVIVANSTEKAL